MGDVEQITADLEKFCSTHDQSMEFASPSKFDNIPESLDGILRAIAANGQLPYSFEWKRVSLVVRQKILYCIDQMNSKAKYAGSPDEYLESCDLVLQRIEMFSEAPFTLQRLCELVLMPDKYYKDTNKYIHALLKCLLVVSGWRKQTEPDLPSGEPQTKEEVKVEPDSTTTTPTTATPTEEKVAQAEVKKEPDQVNAGQPQPDSTTVDSSPEKEEPVFMERPKQEPEDDEEDGGGIFSRQKSPIKTSPVKRKVQILPSNIKLNVGNGKAEPNTENQEETTEAPSVNTEETTPENKAEIKEEPKESEPEKKPDNNETEEEEKRKRKRSVDSDQENDDASSAASTPQKQQKTE